MEDASQLVKTGSVKHALLRFGVVGIFATIVYYMIAIGCSAAGMAPLAANIIGYCIGVGSSFIGHFYFTFKKQGNHTRHLVRFIIVSLLGYILSNIIIVIVVDINNGAFWFAALVVVILIPPVNWIFGRYWAFK